MSERKARAARKAIREMVVMHGPIPNGNQRKHVKRVGRQIVERMAAAKRAEARRHR